MRKIFWIAGLILLVGLACEKKGEQRQGKNAERAVELQKPIQQEEKKIVKDERMMTGTVRYSNLEGSFYELVADGGERYDPVNLPDEYKKDGLRVKFQIREKRDMVGIHMVGKIVEVVRIEKL
jgi:hypothetical protein